VNSRVLQYAKHDNIHLVSYTWLQCLINNATAERHMIFIIIMLSSSPSPRSHH